MDQHAQPVWWKVYERVTNKVLKYLLVHRASERKNIAHVLEKTFAYAYEAYSGLERKNGDLVWDHVMKSLDHLLSVKPDVETIQLCILHDIISVAERNVTEVKDIFGDTVALLLEKFEQLKKIQIKNETEEETSILRQMLVVLADDVRVILVKLSTKLQGLESIDGLPRPRQIMNAKEVLDVYSPIASRLGVYALKIRLEDEAFRILRPKTYARVEKELGEILKEHPDLIEHAKIKIAHILKEHKISADIKGRIKSVYSIARKLEGRFVEHVGELKDLFAMRVLVSTKEDCYKLFGFIHEQYPPMPGRIKDYIALPKSNNYQSLHTTVTGLYESNPYRPVEIQIRTHEMNEIAEYGIAAHSSYKEGVHRISNAQDWQAKLASLNKHYAKKGRFEDAGTELGKYIDKVFVLTPKGDVKAMQKGSTPLDFAYAIHTEIGHRCVAAKVNHKVVPLSHTLQTGDEVEIVTRKDHEPTSTSMMYLRTSSAKIKLRSYLHTKMKDEYVRRGKAMVEQELKALNKPSLDNKMSILDALYPEPSNNMEAKESLMMQIGRGVLAPLQVLSRIFPGIRQVFTPQKPKKKPQASASQQVSLRIDGKTGLQHEYAKCCFPNGVPTDIDYQKTFGYVGVKHTIKIHLQTCNQVPRDDPSRILSVST